MKTIPVRPGHVAIVDDEDYAKCAKYDWLEYGGGYAYRTGPGYMHHLVFGKPPAGMVTDHINQNKMDNRKENLRHVTFTINFINRPSKNGFLRNIYMNKDGTWFVQITRYKKIYHIYSLATVDDAIRARDAFILENFPETVV